MALGKFQMREFNHWKGLTKNNHLGSIFGLQPQKATDIMIQLLALHRGKSLETYLSQFPTKYFDTNDEYIWCLVGSSRRNIPLVEARDFDGRVAEAGGDNLGVATRRFTVVFAEDWFANGEVIVGEKNEAYPLVIKGDAIPEGTNYAYQVELMGGVLTGMPAEELLLGKRFSVDFAPVEQELSRAVGDVRFTSPITMRNEFSTIRIKHKVPGSMIDRKIAWGIPVIPPGGGKTITHDMWMHHVDYQIELEFSQAKANALMYGTSNRTPDGEYKNFGQSGGPIKVSSGLREQMQVANTIYYNTFSLKLIEDMLFELSTSKLDFSERRFILKTGERGAVLFHKAVLETVSGWQSFNYLRASGNPAVIENVSSKLHSNALSAGFQFTEFKAPNGVIVSVDIDPLYDDVVRNKVYHPDGGVAESYRFDILSIGSMDVPNIQIAKIRGREELRGYQWGLRNPFTGEWNNMNMSYDEDSATIHKMTELGIILFDPTRTVSLIPAILA